jgi:hypothetical protein
MELYMKNVERIMSDLAEISMPAPYEVDKLEKMDDPFKTWNLGKVHPNVAEIP